MKFEKAEKLRIYATLLKIIMFLSFFEIFCDLSDKGIFGIFGFPSQ